MNILQKARSHKTQANPRAALAFPRSARLLSAADYSKVFANSRRYSDRYWMLLVRKDQGNESRLGLAIAKKRAKRAVDRNLIKRVARETFRHNRSVLEGKEIVLMNRDATHKADSATLRQSLEKLLAKIHSRRES